MLSTRSFPFSAVFDSTGSGCVGVRAWRRDRAPRCRNLSGGAFLGLLLGSLAAAADAQQYPLRHYSVVDGLPSSQVRDLEQDAGGRLWIATHAGIAVYDGREWHTYNVADGLSWADQLALSRDAAGGFWSISAQTPFKVFSFEGERWQELPGPAGAAPDVAVTAFTTLGTGAAPELAVGTLGDGLYLWSAGEWRRLGRDAGLPDDRVTALAALGRRLFVATAGGLAEVRDGAVEPELGRRLRLPTPYVAGLAVDPGDSASTPTLWLVGDSWLGRLRGELFEGLAAELDLPLRSPPVVAEPDRQGGLYFAGPGVLAYYHPRVGIETLGVRNGLATEGATALLLDREENLWVGSERGVTKVRSRRLASYDRQQGLLEDGVTAVLERRGGELVFGHRGGLSFLRDGAVTVRRLERDPTGAVPGGLGPVGAEPGRSEPVRDLAEDAAGNLWIAAGDLGLARLDPAGRLTWFDAAAGLAGPLTSVLVDGEDTVWAATEEGLFRRRGDTFAPASPEAPRLRVRRLFPAPGGGVLMATAAGLYRYAAGAWRAWTCVDGGGCNSVFAALPHGDGELWVGTATGLYRTAGELLAEVSPPGLAVAQPVFFLLRDADGRIWLGTDDGALRWDGRDTRRFTVGDGLAGRETHRAAGIVDSRGDVWIGTERGVTVYTERRPGPRRAPPVVELRAIESGGHRFPPDAALTLDADENDLTFDFSAVSLVDEDRLQVSALLEGWERAWQSFAGSTRELRYFNLPPGLYRLQLRAAGADGPWSDAVHSATIEIARPYWQQPWFFLALAAGLGAVVFTVQRALAQRRYSRRLEDQVAARVAELNASEERYRHIFERSQAVKLLLDAESFAVIDANRAACRFYGYPLDELKQLTLHHLQVEEDSGSVWLGTESGTHLLAERHRLVNGQVRDVELYSSPTEIRGRPILYVIVQDVTKRRQAEETMSTEKERLAVTLRNIDDGVITTGAEGAILLLNRKAEQITGWSAAEAVGQPLERVLALHAVAGDDEPGEPLRLTPRADETFAPIASAVLLTRGGARKTLELSGSPIRRRSGDVSGLVLAFRDITEKRKIESELVKAQKLEALGILAGGIAHDFNNLLTVLLGNLSLLRIAGGLDGDRAKHLADAEAAVLRARDLTQQLLTFSRGGAPVRRAASIAEVIHESASFVLSGSKLRADVALSADLWVVDIDPGQISQVLNNLLINAIQAMPDGGTVRVSGENLRGRPHSLPPGRYVAIHVTDQGVGIAPEDLSRIFDPYFSTKETGRGLGLASAYSIAKQHDGLLTAASQPGRGTTFSLYLPASAVTRVEPRLVEEQPVDGTGSVLIMDDDERVRKVTSEIVVRLGYRVEHARDGVEAIDLYREALARGRTFDAVIMDLTIPGGMGGREAIRRLRDLDPEVRALVISGYSNDPVMASYRDYGFLGAVHKPFRTQELARALHEVVTAGKGAATASAGD